MPSAFTLISCNSASPVVEPSGSEAILSILDFNVSSVSFALLISLAKLLFRPTIPSAFAAHCSLAYASAISLSSPLISIVLTNSICYTPLSAFPIPNAVIKLCMFAITVSWLSIPSTTAIYLIAMSQFVFDIWEPPNNTYCPKLL